MDNDMKVFYLQLSVFCASSRTDTSFYINEWTLF